MYSLIIGRFQPLHNGHEELIRSVLDEGKRALVAIRDTELSKDNPFPAWQRHRMLMARFQKEYFSGQLEIIVIPDIEEVVYGRKVGWGIREIHLPEVIENVSATDVRIARMPILWLTGNSGAGKSTLADELRTHYPYLIRLDGNEMRATISTEEGFSKEDRRTHNLRVARLARVLFKQGLFVVVCVISPFAELRQEIDAILGDTVRWVYVKRSQEVREDYPYEVPEAPSFTADSDRFSAAANAQMLADWLATKGENDECIS